MTHRAGAHDARADQERRPLCTQGPSSHWVCSPALRCPPCRLRSHHVLGLVKSLSRIRLCNPMDCSLPSSSIHGILQARVLEWVATFPSPGDIPEPGIKPRSLTLQADALPSEPPACVQFHLRLCPGHLPISGLEGYPSCPLRHLHPLCSGPAPPGRGTHSPVVLPKRCRLGAFPRRAGRWCPCSL